MRTNFKSLAASLLAASTLFLTSCDNDKANDVFREQKGDYTITVTPDNTLNSGRKVEIVAAPGKTVKVTAKFTGTKDMFRLYMTKNVFGSVQGAVPFEYPNLGAKKKDGSIDLTKVDKKQFSYTFDFQAPEKNNGVVQYVLWATKARGDYRDISNDNAVGDNAYGLITIKADKNANAKAADFKTFTKTVLAAPLADGSSKSFISLFDNKTYAINQGEEYAALWDFGYYYGATNKASFASTNNYPSSVVNVPTISKVAKGELNKFYIKKSAKDVAFFDGVKTSAALDFISQPSTQTVNGLIKGSILEFVDAYGNKGLIKVIEIKGTDGAKDSITFDVKVKMSAIPVRG